MKRLAAWLVVGAAAVFAALAVTGNFSVEANQPITRISALDFMVDWPKLVGKRVIVTGGSVVAAGEKFSQLRLPGGNAMLYPPWLDREDLRYLFTNCLSFLTNQICTMQVSGVVEQSPIGGPGLTDVDFLTPSQEAATAPAAPPAAIVTAAPPTPAGEARSDAATPTERIAELDLGLAKLKSELSSIDEKTGGKAHSEAEIAMLAVESARLFLSMYQLDPSTANMTAFQAKMVDVKTAQDIFLRLVKPQ